MLELVIPGFASLRLKHLVVDYNGTLALDGHLVPGVEQRLESLSRIFSLHVLTADTFGMARATLANVPCKLTILAQDGQERAKCAYVAQLGAPDVACIGNGRNDRLMLWSAAIGIAVMQREGAATAAISAADLVVPSIIDALDLLSNPLRLVASLRT